MNSQLIALKFDKEKLLIYIAPPPPLAAPGVTDDELVNAKQFEKLDMNKETVKLNPDNCASRTTDIVNNPSFNCEICGYSSIAKAPP